MPNRLRKARDWGSAWSWVTILVLAGLSAVVLVLPA